MAKIEKDNPWPQHHLARIETFLKQISALYNPIAYHNLTHAFDVMVVPIPSSSISTCISLNTAGRSVWPFLPKKSPLC